VPLFGSVAISGMGMNGSFSRVPLTLSRSPARAFEHAMMAKQHATRNTNRDGLGASSVI